MVRIVQKVYEDGIAEGKRRVFQDAILSYLESQFGLTSTKIQNNIKNMTDIDILYRLMEQLYKTETEKHSLHLIDQALQND